MTQLPPSSSSDFSHVETWVFDLDNTLYPAECNLFAQIDLKMTQFVSRALSVEAQEARRIQKSYYADYGTTLNGLMTVHGLNPRDFLDFVHDIDLNRTRMVASTLQGFDDFLFWNFSGALPGVGDSHESGEDARWRSATFAAASGLVDGSLEDAGYEVAFKGRRGTVLDGAYVGPVDGIFLGKGPGNSPLLTVLQTGADGTLIDPEAIYLDEADGSTMNLPVIDMSIERDGFRGRLLAINVSMGTEDSGWGGVYITDVGEAINRD